jgi:translocator assembly and maintenance protein 41
MHKQLLRRFPTVQYAMAYGSGVMPNHDHKPSGMIDLIFGVDDTVQWHAANLERNKSHYSGLRWLGRDAISAVQNLRPPIYYNTNVALEDGTRIKYGVISLDNLHSDLLHWNDLYVAGRMHKPCSVLQITDETEQAQKVNLTNAVRAGKLLLGEGDHSHVDIFRSITSLSYLGDVRVGVAEDPNKINSIVDGNLQHFHTLYADILSNPELNAEPAVLWAAMPSNVRKHGDIRTALTAINGPASKNAIVKGLLTAGPVKAVKYGARKVAKRLGLKVN